MAPDTGNVYKGQEVYKALERGEKLVSISPKAYKRISSAFRAKRKLIKMQKASRRGNRH